jgi:pimeloyl-ACP methyl ester carboxylesterase
MKTIPQLHYTITGAGPTVVLLHGFMATSRYWDKTITELTSNHTVIAIDLLGFGNSPKPGCSRYDLDAQRASIDATLSALNITQPFTLVGHSMGSLVALKYAVKNPQRVAKLLLTNMPIFASTKEAKKDIYSTRFIYRFALQPGLHGLIWPLFKAVLLLKFLPERLTGNLKTHKTYMFQSNGFARVRSMHNLIFQAKVEADLKLLEVSTEIISGLSDRAVYLHNLYQFKLNNHINTHEVIGGHHLPQSNPQFIASLV